MPASFDPLAARRSPLRLTTGCRVGGGEQMCLFNRYATVAGSWPFIKRWRYLAWSRL